MILGCKKSPSLIAHPYHTRISPTCRNASTICHHGYDVPAPRRSLLTLPTPSPLSSQRWWSNCSGRKPQSLQMRNIEFRVRLASDTSPGRLVWTEGTFSCFLFCLSSFILFSFLFSDDGANQSACSFFTKIPPTIIIIIITLKRCHPILPVVTKDLPTFLSPRAVLAIIVTQQGDWLSFVTQQGDWLSFPLC